MDAVVIGAENSHPPNAFFSRFRASLDMPSYPAGTTEANLENGGMKPIGRAAARLLRVDPDAPHPSEFCRPTADPHVDLGCGTPLGGPGFDLDRLRRPGDNGRPRRRRS